MDNRFWMRHLCTYQNWERKIGITLACHATLTLFLWYNSAVLQLQGHLSCIANKIPSNKILEMKDLEPLILNQMKSSWDLVGALRIFESKFKFFHFDAFLRPRYSQRQRQKMVLKITSCRDSFSVTPNQESSLGSLHLVFLIIFWKLA